MKGISGTDFQGGRLFEKTFFFFFFTVKIGTHALFNNDLWALRHTFDKVIKDQIFLSCHIDFIVAAALHMRKRTFCSVDQMKTRTFSIHG